MTFADLWFRARQFLIAVIGAGLVLALALSLSGLADGFHAEAAGSINAVGATSWVMPAERRDVSPRSRPSAPPTSPPWPASEGCTGRSRCSSRRRRWSSSRVRRRRSELGKDVLGGRQPVSLHLRTQSVLLAFGLAYTDSPSSGLTQLHMCPRRAATAAWVAQSVEQRTRNAQVRSSNLLSGSRSEAQWRAGHPPIGLP